MTRSGDEQQQVREWFYARTSTDPLLAAAMGLPLDKLADHIWPDVAGEDVVDRWVVYQAQESFPVQPLGPWDRLVVPVPLNVRCVARADDSAWAYPAMRRIHDLLQGNWNHPGLAGSLVLTGQRQSGLDYPEQEGGIRYRHVGGIYTIQVN